MKQIISNPFYQGLFAIVAFGIGLYFSLRKDKGQLPLYSIEQSRTIATTPSNKLKIVWDGDTLPNVKTVRILLWNGGNEYIDKGNFSVTQPVTIFSDKKCNILDIRVLQRSRNDLSIAPVIDESKSAVRLAISGDDALDPGDGVLYQVVYSSTDSINWRIKGRVKNIPSGFEQVSWKEANQQGVFSTLKLLLIPLFIMFTPVTNLISTYNEYKKGDKIERVTYILIVVMAAGFLFGLYDLYDGIIKIKNRQPAPEWVKV